jgi:general secretion pathway protein F
VKFAYELLTADGKLERGTVEAGSEPEARRALARQGHTLLALETGGARGRAGRIAPDALLLAFTELATLLHSGLGIAESVASIVAAHENDALAGALEVLGRAIGQGKPFAEALRAAELPLPEYFYQLARAGEMTGRLAHSLDKAIAQFAYERELATEMRNALIYPAVLVTVGLAAVGLMFAFVVPRFAGLLKDAENLPWLAWAVLSGGSFVSRHFALLGLLLLAAVAGVVTALRRPRVREALLEALAGAPLVGTWLAESATASWSALLGALLGQGVPMLDALELANEGVQLATRRGRLQAAARAVKGGLSLSKALEEQGALSPTAYNLLRTGERAGKLPEMLEALAALSAKSGRNRMKRVLLLIEPLAILVIGAGIGTIVIGIVLAITSLSDIPI